MIGLLLSPDDHDRLVYTPGIDVMSELLRLNNSAAYGHRLDVIRLTRLLQMERIRFFIAKGGQA